MITQAQQSFLGLLLIFSFAANATSNTDCAVKLLAYNPEAPFIQMAREWREGWGERGFHGKRTGAAELNGDTYALATKNGVMWWAQRFIFVKDVEEARAIDTEIRKIKIKGIDLTRGGYIIGGADLLQPQAGQDPKADRVKLEGSGLRETLRKADGFFYFGRNDEVIRISFAEAEERFSYNHVYQIGDDGFTDGRTFYTHEGWATTKRRGMIDYAVWDKSDQIRKYRSLARMLARAGYRFLVNKDFMAALNYARDQVRNGKASSRYQSAPFYNAMVEMYRQGVAFVVDVYAPDGKLKGGVLNLNNNNLIIGDTVYSETSEDIYTDANGKERSLIKVIDDNGDEKKIDPIDIPRIADVVSIDYFAGLGIRYIDVGAVSAYSGSLLAELETRERYLEIVASLPKGKIDLPEVLDPYQYPDLDFRELARKGRNFAITGKKFVGGLPLATPYAIERAKAAGLVPGELNIYVVESMEALKSLATKLNDPDALYYIGTVAESQETIQQGGAARETMLKIMPEGLKIIKDAELRTKLIKPDTLKIIIYPRVGPERISWTGAGSEFGPRIVVKGWALE